MPQGFQVFDANGNVIVDLTTRLFRIIGSVRVNSNGSLSVPDFALGTPFYFQFREAAGQNPYFRVTVSGTTMTWNSLVTTSSFALIYYGIY